MSPTEAGSARGKLPLTPERAAVIEAARAEWLAVGLSTAPADFDAAEASITRLYERAGRERPYFVRLDSPMAAEVYINLVYGLGGQLWDQLGGQLWDQLWGQLWDQLRGQLWDQLRGQLRGQLWDQLRGQLRGQLWDQLGGQLWDQLWDQLGDQQLRYMGTSFWGSWDFYWMWLDGGRRVGAIYDAALDTALDDQLTICRSIGWWYPFADFCILTGRPSIIARDDAGRLHSAEGPALAYRDGYTLHSWHGVTVPAHVIERPEEITASAVDAEPNAEVRRILVERMGIGRYMEESGAEVIDQAPDDHPVRGVRGARLLRREMKDDEPILTVECINSTPEPDGSTKRYWLRVHPECRPLLSDGSFGRPQKLTALNAIASTFGLRGSEYRPEIET